jgi:small subunit ribosomal protein S8
MVMTDPIADMLTRLRNAAAVGQTEVRLPGSKEKQAIAKVLKEEGYLTDVASKDGELTLQLAQTDGGPKMNGIRRISKPGRRLYAGKGDLPRVRHGIGTAVVSTSQGVMSADTARKRKLGGEVLLEIF